MKKILIAVMLVFLFNCGVDAICNEEFAPDTVLVQFKPGVSEEEIAEIHRQNEGKIDHIITGLRHDIYVVKVPKGQVKKAIANYLKNPNVYYAEPDYVIRLIGGDKIEELKIGK